MDIEFIRRFPMAQKVLISGAFLFTIFVLRMFIRAAISPLRHLPGPFEARLSRFWYWRKVTRGDWEKTNIELHRKYGPIVRITPYEYSIDDPAAVKIMYGHGTDFLKSPWYKAWGGVTKRPVNMFVEQDPKVHAACRRQVANLYSTTSLLQMEGAVTECTAALVETMNDLAESRTAFDMQHWLQRYAFDNISLITLARTFGFVKEGTDTTGPFSALHSYTIYATNVGVFSELHGVLIRILDILPSPGGILWIVGFVKDQVKERLRAIEESGGDIKKNDFLAKLTSLHTENPANFTLEDLFNICIMNIAAGSDTTSVSLAGIMYGFLKQPETLEKLRSEIREKTAKGEMSNPVTFQEAQKMPYLQACIKEGLRMHPATGLPMGRIVPQGGATIADVYFPKGTVVGINAWVAHRNRQVFGYDADIFRPDRWLEDPDAAARMERYWIPFGHGSRTCIGKNISLLEISKVVPELARNFDFALVNPHEELKCDNHWFVQQSNFMCTVSRREKC